MPLGPEDVIRKSFTTTRLKPGYDQTEVDSFLEEIVAELRRRDLDKEDLLVQLQRASTGSADGERLALELEQLDLIRRERRQLVEELRDLSDQVTAAKTERYRQQQAVSPKEPTDLGAAVRADGTH